MDPVPQSLKTFNARRVREEVEAENLRFCTSGLAAPPEGAANNLDDAISSPPPIRSPKAKQRGRGKGEGGGNG